ncbi:hypothetical protein BaRGS_00031460 [Batillaria attramentaria]|uniref:G-protein coupled receptors family 1 profile domain-containing protein n=1 Tax=Batillaria attramentaria TaxID=370345 RepID=A0ABD0JRS2_9CAEN
MTSVNTTTPSAGCLVLRPSSSENKSSFLPWDNPDNVINMRAAAILERVVVSNLLPLVCLFGIISNCLNMAVFYRQGVRDRITLCLFCLALVDAMAVLTVFCLYVERLLAQVIPHMAGDGPLYR